MSSRRLGAVESKEIERFLNWDGEGALYHIGNTDKYGWLCTAGYPIVEKKSGEVKAFVLADVTMLSIFSAARSFALQFSLSILALTMLIAWISTRRMNKTVVAPINRIAEAAQRYVSDKKNGEGVSDHFGRLNIHTGDEIENLSIAMADMEQDIDNYLEDLTAVTAEKGRESFRQLASEGKMQALGRAIETSSKNHTVGAAQWHIDCAVNSLNGGNLNRHFPAENLAAIYTAHELASQAEAGAKIDKEAFEASKEQMMEDPLFRKMVDRYCDDPEYKARINKDLSLDGSGSILALEYHKLKNPQPVRRPEQAQPQPQPQP